MTPFTVFSEVTDEIKNITYKVHGFWSTRYVSIWQNRCYKTGNWREPEISWSCGGRDVKEEPSDIVAAICLSQAIAHAAECAGSMK